MKQKINIPARLRGLKATATVPQNMLLLIFGIEGILYQFSQSVNNFGNSLYATNLGATDSQIGMIQMVPNLIALAIMLPIGVLADRMRYSRTVPIACLTIMGVMYFFYGTVSRFGDLRMAFYFLFLGMVVASAVIYNAQWQNFFADVVPVTERNFVLTFRSRIMFFIGIVTPLLCGIIMSRATGTGQKIGVLRIFFYLSGIFVLLQALALRRIPCAPRTEKPEPFSLRIFSTAFKDAFTSKYFRRFFLTGVLFYAVWQIDWSMWYIEETQYAMMDESHLSIINAVCSISQMIAIGFFSKLIQKRSPYFVMIIVQIGYVLGVSMALFAMMPFIPDGAKPWVFIGMAIIPNMLECSFSLCLVQIMLASVPEKNRSLIISIYTMVITLSNAFVPFLGVQIYTALGADFNAVVYFDLIVMALRVVALIEIIWFYRVTKKEGRLFASSPDPLPAAAAAAEQ